MDVNIRINSSISKINEFTSIDVNSLCINNRNQYLVSLASFDEIDIFAVKSLLLCPARAYSILAPIDVPLLRSCFEMIYSFSFNNSLYKEIILKEN